MGLLHEDGSPDKLAKFDSDVAGPPAVGPPSLSTEDRLIPPKLVVSRPALPAALLVVAALTLSPLAMATQPNPEQSGENGECLDFNALYLTPELQADAIQVAGGTGYQASQEGGAQIYIDFYDATGRHIGDNARNPRTTPGNATTGTVCVGQIGGGWPDLPALGATWTYQDGY